MDIAKFSTPSLIAYHAKLNTMEWERNIRLKHRKDRHSGIDFNNQRFLKHKADVKQELEKRGMK